MNRTKVAVLFGGCSPEYRVSLQSAAAVLRNMDPDRYEPVPVGITAGGDWFRYRGDPDRIEADTWCTPDVCTPVSVCVDRSAPGLLIREGNSVHREVIAIAFPVMHGCNGEDGTVQGLFELAGIPLAGCGVLASALCMDKDRAHRLVRAGGIPVPESFTLTPDSKMGEARVLAQQIGWPVFVKPVRAGSSFGISRVTDSADFEAAVRKAFQYDTTVLVEEAIEGFEVGCAVLGSGADLIAGVPDEIELTQGFFDYEEKYTLKTSAIHVPARVSSALLGEIQNTAKRIYQILGCTGFARVDLFLEPGHRLVFNEVNTIPGFTSHSRYPNMMKAAGLSFQQVISRILEEAAER